MKKYKVCVYAICKNESKHIKRWYESMKEADEIYVLDTGSTDDSVELLKTLGVNVSTKTYEKWRFDEARNDSLALVPLDTDICVCTDIDEVFNKGWREELERIWNDDVNRVKYCLNFSFDEYNNPATTLYISKIHSRNNFKWVHIVHEVLECSVPTHEVVSDKIILNHYPDKLKSRSMYLSLLEQSVIEEPESDRNLHYLGREYMYNSEFSKAIATFHKHLKHPKALWKDERCASMRFMARCYNGLEYKEESIMWYELAIKECPELREGYVELAYLYYIEEKFDKVYDLLTKAYSIKERSQGYINEDFCWNSFIDDLMSYAAYKLGKKEEALKYIKKALEKDPNNIRYQLNLDIIESM